jgi:hypothetical protein
VSDHFTICILLFGDFPQLARRCLTSIAPVAAATGVTLRIGMNAVSDATRSLVTELFSDANYQVIAIDSGENICKYPMMRKLLYELDGGVTTPRVMWFDDDSCVKDPTRGAAWLESLRALAAGAALIGSKYTKSWEGKQREWVKAQPWYGGNDPTTRPKAVFVQGAWWVADMDVLRSLDYPWPALRHRGGDVMLGEAMLQRGMTILRYNDNVAINADAALTESKALRRGVDEKPVGYGGPEAAPTIQPATWPLPPVPARSKKKWIIPKL